MLPLVQLGSCPPCRAALPTAPLTASWRTRCGRQRAPRPRPHESRSCMCVLGPDVICGYAGPADVQRLGCGNPLFSACVPARPQAASLAVPRLCVHCADWVGYPRALQGRGSACTCVPPCLSLLLVHMSATSSPGVVPALCIFFPDPNRSVVWHRWCVCTPPDCLLQQFDRCVQIGPGAKQPARAGRGGGTHIPPPSAGMVQAWLFFP